MSEKRIWELLARQFNQEISEEEVRELHSLLRERQDNVLNMDLLSDIHALALKPDAEARSRKKSSAEALQKAVRGEAEIGIEKRWRGWRIKGNPVRMVALGLFFLAGIAGYFLVRPGKAGSAFNRIVTRPGSKTLINLPDSSTVILSSACQFEYNKEFGVNKREMRLVGEAYFDIHKNPDMPLILHMGNVDIRVLGTAFHVKANPEDSVVEAVLVNGLIEVSLKTDPERKILLRPHEKIVIRKNDDHNKQTASGLSGSGLSGREQVISVTREEAMDSSYMETAWAKDKMIFRKESFGELVKKMERWYSVRIILADTTLQDMQFTGSFEKENLDEAFQALQQTASFHYKIDGKTVTVTK